MFTTDIRLRPKKGHVYFFFTQNENKLKQKVKQKGQKSNWCVVVYVWGGFQLVAALIRPN